MQGENVVKKIGNDSRKIIRKQLDRGQKLHFACSKFEKLHFASDRKFSDERLCYLIWTQDANANHLYLTKCSFGTRWV